MSKYYWIKHSYMKRKGKERLVLEGKEEREMKIPTGLFGDKKLLEIG